MKKIYKILILVIVIISSVFYYFKREQINNILDYRNTAIAVNNGHYKFGTINLKDTLKHTFFVKNITSDDLVIKNVQTNCGCTITDFTKTPIKEGDSATVLLTFIPNGIGKTEKSILVEANTSPPFTVLTISGDVIK